MIFAFKATTVATLFLFLTVAYGANTIETFDEKHGYFEVDMGYAGVGQSIVDRVLKGHALWGKGFNDWISGYLGVEADGDGYLSDGGPEVTTGVICTPVRRDHFNLDLFAEIGAGDSTDAGIYLDPGFELNFDAAPNMEKAGIYFDVDELLTGEDTTTGNRDSSNIVHHRIFTPVTNLRCAGYVTLFKGQQLHLQLDEEWRASPLWDQNKYVFKAVRIGYNIMLSDVFQLTTEIDFLDPFNNDRSIGFNVGLGRW
jgi:hypothetical protein